MKNYAALALSVTLLVGLGFGLSSCKDDEPPVPPKLSFAQSEMSVNEDDGVIEVELKLDRPYSKDLNVEYKLAGTASDQDAVGTAGADYEITGDHGVALIESGATSGIIEIEIYNDNLFEEDETIEISIVDANTADVQVTTDNKTVVTITSEDAQLVASFTSPTMTVNEADGAEFFLVPVQLDKAAPADMVIEYTILQEEDQPDATDSLSAWNEDPSLRGPYDYYINAEPALVGKLEIPSGATSANIEIQIVSDFYFEADENIRIELKDNGAAALGTNASTTVTITQENGKVIALLWDPSYTDVDMDMFLFIGPDAASIKFPENVLTFSIRPSTTVKEEAVFLPSVFSSDVAEATFGLSYVYYQGTADPMNFEVHFADLTDGELDVANAKVYAATYTAANLNMWDKETGKDPIVEQTFRIVDGAYVDISDITVPTAGSRMRAVQLPPDLRKSSASESTRIFSR